MTLTATASSIPPLYFATGNAIVEEDLQAVAEQLNYSAGQCPVSYVSLVTGDANWWTGGTGELAPLLATITSAAFETRLSFWIYIEPNQQVIVAESIGTNPASTTTSVRFTIGGGSITNTHAANSTTTDSDTIATSTTGTGWQLVTVETQRDTGSGTGVLRAVRVQSNAIAATALPFPAPT